MPTLFGPQLEQPLVTLLWAAGLPHYNELLGLLGPMWKDPEAVMNAEAPKDNDIDWGEDAKRKTRNKLAYIKLRRFLRGGGGAAWGPHKWELKGPGKKPSSAVARRDLKGWFGLDWGGQDRGGEREIRAGVQAEAQGEDGPGGAGGMEPASRGPGKGADGDGGSAANASSSGMERFVGRKGWEGWVVGGEQGGGSKGGADGQQQGEEEAETEEERAQRLAKIQNRWEESFPEAEFIREHKPLVFARALTDAAALLERNGTMTVVQLRCDSSNSDGYRSFHVVLHEKAHWTQPCVPLLERSADMVPVQYICVSPLCMVKRAWAMAPRSSTYQTQAW